MLSEFRKFLFPVFVLTLTCFGCSKSVSQNESTSEIATAIASGQINARPDGALARSSRLTLIPEAIAGYRCPTPITGAAGQDCSVDPSGKVMTLKYNSCNFGNNSAVWKGSLILTSSATVSCGSFPSDSPGATLIRGFGPDTTRTIGSSVHVTKIETESQSGYSFPVSGGARITYETNSDRSIDILGVHVTATKTFRGNGNEGKILTAWDRSISTRPSALDESKALKVTRNSSGLVLNGTLVTQNNLERFTGTSVFEGVTYVSGCCQPVSGKVTTTFSGSKDGSETLTFSNGNCGSAAFKDASGATSQLTLIHCL